MSLDLSQRKLQAGLYLVSTPIGNLGDMTTRGIDILRTADVILCEDTRVTGRLLSHFGIKAKLQIYNDQTEQGNPRPYLDMIKAGKVVALVSDAGTPLASDPGYKLVRACIENEIMVTSAPGANAILTALQLSGLPTDAFLFGGFLPPKKQDRLAKLKLFGDVPATLIFFERASRVPAFLAEAHTVLQDRSIAIVREITKLFEDVRRGNFNAVQQSIQDHPIKGEVVIVIGRAPDRILSDTLDLDALLLPLLKKMSVREAANKIATQTGLPRRTVYNHALTLKK